MFEEAYDQLPHAWKGANHLARFDDLLQTGAFLEAAYMLVPDGWEVSLYWGCRGFLPEAQMETEETRSKWQEPYSASGDTPALALLNVILLVNKEASI